MIRAMFVVFLVAACTGDPLQAVAEEENSPRIVGGTDADIADHPHQVSVSFSVYFCGGTIISKDWALSLATCCTIPGLGASAYIIRSGSSYRNSGGTTHSVSDIIAHQKYDVTTMDYNFALLKVSTPFNFGTTVKAIPLPSQGQNTAAGSSATITGFGQIVDSGANSAVLQVAQVTVQSQQACQALYGSAITDTMICAGFGGTGVCAGDSGGPMVVGGQLVGVVMGGPSPCATLGRPDIYAKVSSVRDWIDASMECGCAWNGAESVVRFSGIVASLCVVIAVIVR